MKIPAIFQNHRKMLVLIIVVSVLLRIGAAVYMGSQVVELPGTSDQISYHNLAIRVLQGHGFSFGENWWPVTKADMPTAHWSFLYTFYLVGVYGLFGIQPLIARLIQALIVGILQPLLVYQLGKKVFSPGVGLVAAAWIALYGYFIYYGGALMTEMFYITAILWVFKLVFELAETPEKRGLALLFGLGLGIVALLRQLFVLFVPFMFLWILWAARKKGFGKTLVSLILSGVVVAAMILPFTAYNYARFHRFVLLNTNAGYVFYWGNHPIYGTQFVPILTPDMPSYGDLLPQELVELDEAALDSALMQRGLEFITADPGRYVLLSLSRIPHYFMFWPSADSGLISNITRVISFGVAMPFMLAGVIMILWPNKKKFADWLARREILLILFLVVYAGIHILTWTLVRYRLPVDAVLLPVAAYSLTRLAQKIWPQLGAAQ